MSKRHKAAGNAAGSTRGKATKCPVHSILSVPPRCAPFINTRFNLVTKAAESVAARVVVGVAVDSKGAPLLVWHVRHTGRPRRHVLTSAALFGRHLLGWACRRSSAATLDAG